jgi:hypothetical protein
MTGRAALAAALAVLAACVGLLLSTPGDGYWINDCGNKALVSQRLVDTGFASAAFARPDASFDPTGRWFPVPAPFSVRRGQEILSAYPPAYPALAAPLYAALGPIGLRLPAALGVAASVLLFALWAAPAAGRGGALLGSLLLGLGTPLFFYGVTVWEHAPSLALALFALLLASRGGAARYAAAGLLVGLACWLREELLLLAPALVLAALLRREPLRYLAAFAAGVAPALAALAAWNARHFGSPLGGHVLANLGSAAGGDFLAGEVSRLTAVSGLLGGFGHGPAERAAFTAAALCLPLAGAVAPRRLRASPALPLLLAGLGLVAWAVAAGRMFAGEDPLRELTLHNGLLLQWPLLALAGQGARRVFSDPAWAGMRLACGAGLAFLLLVLAAGMLFPSGAGVQVGAGVHWGPRVLLPALPVLVLLAWAAVSDASPAARAAFALLALAGLLSTALSVWFLVHQKQDAARLTERLRALPPRIVVTSHPLLAQHLPSLWRDKTLLLTADPASLRDLAALLSLRQVDEFVFVGPPGAVLSGLAPGLACRVAFQHRGEPLGYLDLDAQVCSLRPPPRSGPR